MKWRKPSGIEIETLDDEATIQHCVSLDWEPLEGLSEHNEPTPDTDLDANTAGNASALQIDEDAVLKAFQTQHGAIPEGVLFVSETEFHVEYDGENQVLSNYADALAALDAEKKRLADEGTTPAE